MRGFPRLPGLAFFASVPLFLIAAVPSRLLAQGDNPTGVAGIYNGNITTAGNYDPYTLNAIRTIDDIVVPGSVGAYPLKWTRYYNTHNSDPNGGKYGRWTFSYVNYGSGDNLITFPDGRTLNFGADCPPSGVEETATNSWIGPGGQSHPAIVLADGGIVGFVSSGQTIQYISPTGQPGVTVASTNLPTWLIDPYGQITTMIYKSVGSDSGNPVLRMYQIKEPGGRYLQLNWTPWDGIFGDEVIQSVQAFDAQGNLTQSVTYTWQYFTSNADQMITAATYSDGPSAAYSYISDKNGPHLKTANDVRYSGAMHQILYNYVTYVNEGQNVTIGDILGEYNVNGTAVSTTWPAPTPPPGSYSIDEKRGDGAMRTFTYGQGDRKSCLATQGKLTSYSDFLGHTTSIGYDSSGDIGSPHYGFINSVTDPNLNTTTYERQTNSWGITKITHPDGTYIQQTFWPSGSQNQPYYLASRTDEKGNETDYQRDGKNRITEKQYPPDAYGARAFETFSYNPLGQVLTHRMTNGAYQHFQYDSNGRLLAKTNPTLNSDHDSSLGSDPQTTYTYYTASDVGGAWTDRIKTETDPRGNSTTYEYDHKFNNGQDTGTAGAGRGLITKITHPDGTSRSFGYDIYGNKVSEQDENNNITRYTYDEYRRVKSVQVTTHAPTTYTYPGQTSELVTTFNGPISITLPAGETTTTTYDPNWRKTSITQVDGSTNPTTTFYYDAYSGYQSIGNLIAVQDPRGLVTTYTYDNRDRNTSVTDSPNLTTTFHYDGVNNVYQIDRPDGFSEPKTYDSMHRLLTDTLPKDNTTGSLQTVETTYDYYPGTATQMAGELEDIIDGKQQKTTFSMTQPGTKHR